MVRRAVSDEDRRNWLFAGGCCFAADVEPKQAEFFFPVARVLPQLFYTVWLLLEDVECCDARSRNRRRVRSREKKRPGSVIEEINQITRPANISAQCADCLGECSHLDIHAAVLLEVVNRSAPIAPEHARGMRVV